MTQLFFEDQNDVYVDSWATRLLQSCIFVTAMRKDQIQEAQAKQTVFGIIENVIKKYEDKQNR